jgi:hypothetical protein
MARRKSKLNDAFLGIAIVIAGIAWAVGKVLDMVGVATPIVIIALVIVAFVWFKYAQRKKRIEYLLDKYGDEDIVNRIMQGHYWEGQTAQQLRDSVGSPLSIDTKSMATRKRAVWKYRSRGRNRYGLRIILDDDVVIGWEQKNG